MLASVRSGHLKKDLSLLLELEQDTSASPAANTLPDPYRFKATDTREPSIRPMQTGSHDQDSEILNRHFQSWTNMRHYYRMYRNASDARVNVSTNPDTDGFGASKRTGSQPYSEAHMCLLYRDKAKGGQWQGK